MTGVRMLGAVAAALLAAVGCGVQPEPEAVLLTPPASTPVVTPTVPRQPTATPAPPPGPATPATTAADRLSTTPSPIVTGTSTASAG